MQKELLSLLGGLLAAGKTGRGGLETRVAAVGGENYNYQVHVPDALRGQADLPVVVFLHGIRERGSNGFVPQDGPTGALVNHYFQKVPAILVLPQCRPGVYWSDAAMEKMVLRTIDQTVAEFAADASRVYLIGVSMGGYGAWHFAAREPERFAAVVPICGGSPLLSGDRFTPIAERVRGIPAWVFHGAEDRIVPVSESRAMVEAIRTRGGEVKYSEYAKVGHHVWMNALQEKELLPWILRQRREAARR